MKLSLYLSVVLLAISCSSEMNGEDIGNYTLDMFRQDGVHQIATHSQPIVHPYDELKKKVYLSSIPIQSYGDQVYAFNKGNAVALIDLESMKEEKVYQFLDKYILISIAKVDKSNIWCSTYSLPYQNKYQIWKINIKDKIAVQIAIAASANFSHESDHTSYIGEDNLIHIRSEKGSERVLDIVADSPTLLPNGQGIVYIKHGFFQSLEHLLFSSNKSQTIKRSYFGSFAPPIRISNDGKAVAFTFLSDIFPAPIVVFDLDSGSQILKAKAARNWLFK